MQYSMITLRQALKNIGNSKGVNAFMWEDAAFQGTMHPALLAKFTYGRANGKSAHGNYLNDLLEYCWLVYSKAKDAVGAQLIGRTGDLWVPQHLDKCKIQTDIKKRLWDENAKGNIQVMDKWSKTVNDCWILGGVHRLANFNLLSTLSMENLWNFQTGYHVVTARELLGLIHFGYKPQKQGALVSYVCADPSLAHNATVEEYTSFMKQMEDAGPASVLALLRKS